MNITGPIKALIAADSTANGLLAGRVYAGVLQQNSTYPAAVMNLITSTTTNTKTQAGDLDFINLQVDVYGSTVASASAAAQAIRNAIQYQTSGDIKHIQFERLQDGFSEVPELFRLISEYSISYKP